MLPSAALFEACTSTNLTQPPWREYGIISPTTLKSCYRNASRLSMSVLLYPF
jgi:hypothetical protein